MMHLICNRAPGIIEQYIGKPLDKISEFDIDDAVSELDEPANRTEAELKGYLIAVYDSRKPLPDGKHASPDLSEPLQILINQLYRREPKLFKKYFSKPLKKITKTDVANACVRIKKILKVNGYANGTAILRGYLMAIHDADITSKGTCKKHPEVRTAPENTDSKGSVGLGLDDPWHDTELYDLSVDEKEWPTEARPPYENDGRITIFETEPATRAPAIDGETHWKDLADLKEMQDEHFYSILNAIRKEPSRYFDLETGLIVNYRLAKLIVEVLDDIRSVDPDFDKKVDIPGYMVIRTAELYKSAKRCLKKQQKGGRPSKSHSINGYE
jgi:hypothetical protein